MQCPACKQHFHPQTNYSYLGSNGYDTYAEIRYQTCPSCHKFIFLLHEFSDLKDWNARDLEKDYHMIWPRSEKKKLDN